MGKPTMTAKSKFYLDKYWTFCDEIRLGFNRIAKFQSCEKLWVYAYFGTDDESLWRTPHDKKPDSTNILKGVEDALLIDDSKNEVFCTKLWWPINEIKVNIYGVQF